jgi:hypothetical protein
MASELEARPPGRALSVIGRAVTLGAGAGAIVGGVVGTIVIPIIGSFFGVVVGSIVGAAFGLANGVVLIGVVKLTTSRRAAALAAAVTSCLCAAGTLGSKLLPRSDPHTINWIIVAVLTLLGAALGPIAARGARTLQFGPDWGARSPFSVLGTSLAIGGASGITLGAVIGLVIGIMTYLPTAPAAAVEGGLIGSVIGAVLAMFVGALVIAPYLRPRV